MNIISFIAGSKFWLIAIAGALVLGFTGGWHEKSLRVPALLEDQRKSDLKQCNIDKQISREANNEIIKDRDAIANRLRALKLQHAKTRVPVASKAKLSNGGPEHAGQNGIDTDTLREFAAECEQYRSEVITCTTFIDKTWAAHGQE